MKWCGVTSQVTAMPRALPARTARSEPRGAQVGDVEAAAGEAGQRDVALDPDLLGLARNAAQAEPRGVEALVRHAVALERRILAVIDHRHAAHRRVLERAAHQQRRQHRPAVVRDGDAAGGACRSPISASCSPFEPIDTAPIG